jgi:hypothetical protein
MWWYNLFISIKWFRLEDWPGIWDARLAPSHCGPLGHQTCLVFISPLYIIAIQTTGKKLCLNTKVLLKGSEFFVVSQLNKKVPGILVGKHWSRMQWKVTFQDQVGIVLTLVTLALKLTHWNYIFFVIKSHLIKTNYSVEANLLLINEGKSVYRGKGRQNIHSCQTAVGLVVLEKKHI